MTSTTTAPRPAGETDADRKKRKRGAVVKLSFAGVALLGIGAAATSSAWSDQAWFSATADAAKVELQASLTTTAGDFVDADTTGAAVVIPASTFANMNQGQSKTVTVYVRNSGSVPLTLAAPTLTRAGAFFTDTNVTATATKAAAAAVAGTVLPGNDLTPLPVIVTITTPAAWADTYQASTGTLTLTFNGQS